MSQFNKDWGFECDYCSNTVGGDPYDFEESLHMRDNLEGWINRKIDGVWYSFCCQECFDKWQAKHLNRPTPRKLHK